MEFASDSASLGLPTTRNNVHTPPPLIPRSRRGGRRRSSTQVACSQSQLLLSCFFILYASAFQPSRVHNTLKEVHKTPPHYGPSFREGRPPSSSSSSSPVFPLFSYASDGLGLGLGIELDEILRRGNGNNNHPSSSAAAGGWQTPLLATEHLLGPSSGSSGSSGGPQAAGWKARRSGKTIIREAWQATKEESQIMQELILRAQADPWEMLRLLFQNPSGCNHVNVCTVLHRCGKLSDRLPSDVQEALSEQLLPVVAAVLPACRGRQLCNVAWALVRLGMPDVELFKATIRRLTNLQVLRSCNGGEIAMAMWAVAAAGMASQFTDFLELAAEPISEKTAGLRPREIGLITWAYATWLQSDLKNHNGGGVAGVVLEEVDNEDDEDGLSSASASSNDDKKWLVKPMIALLEATLHCESQLKAKDISMIAWAFGRICPLDWNAMGPHVDMLCAVLASSALKSIRHFSAQDLAELAVGVVAMQYDNANLMQIVAYEASRKLRSFSHRELSNIIWAYGKVFRRPRKFVLAAAEEALARLPYFSPTELANLAWALTVLEVYDVVLFRNVFTIMQRRYRERDLQEGDLNQLYQVFCLLRLQAPEAMADVSPELAEAMERAWAGNKEREKRTTNRQAAVSRVLDALKLPHVIEAEHDIDILLPEQGMALEVDGPAHFLRNTGHPMGHTIMKRRLLQLMGYGVVSIPHFEWDRIPYWSSMELKRYIQRKCQTEEILQFSSQDFSTQRSFPKFGKKTRFD